MIEKSTQDLARAWLAQRERRDRLRAELASVEEVCSLTAGELAARIAPRDIKPLEKIAVWVRAADKQEVLVEVEAKPAGSGTINLQLRIRGENEPTPSKARGEAAHEPHV